MAGKTLRYERGEESATVMVVRAVAAIRDTPIEALDPLHDYIDTDSLDRLVERGDDVEVRFRYHDCAVTVLTDELLVRPVSVKPRVRRA